MLSWPLSTFPTTSFIHQTSPTQLHLPILPILMPTNFTVKWPSLPPRDSISRPMSMLNTSCFNCYQCGGISTSRARHKKHLRTHQQYTTVRFKDKSIVSFALHCKIIRKLTLLLTSILSLVIVQLESSNALVENIPLQIPTRFKNTLTPIPLFPLPGTGKGHQFQGFPCAWTRNAILFRIILLNLTSIANRRFCPVCFKHLPRYIGLNSYQYSQRNFLWGNPS